MTEQLWAPWRAQYIKNVDSKEDGCIFCTKPAATDDRSNLILFRGSHNFVMLNRYPYNSGHLMIIPYLHTAEISALPQATVAELWALICTCKRAIVKAFSPDAFNIGMNLGRTAGAGIDQHLHMHMVPRWNGDTNFMPVIAETKVISIGMEEAYDALQVHFMSEAGISSGEPPL